MQKSQGDRSPKVFQPVEFEQKVLHLARVARMVAGGRRFNFRATVVLGNRKGKVGVGIGKGADVSIAINKAARNAQKNAILVPMTPDGTIPHEIIGKQSGSIIYLKPALRGRGIIAGGAARVVCDLAGYHDIVAKVLSRSTNKLNNALATINALSSISYDPKIQKQTAPISKKEEVVSEKEVKKGKKFVDKVKKKVTDKVKKEK